MDNKDKSRRRFIKTLSGSAIIVGLPSIVSAMESPSEVKRVAANDKISIGLIGCRGIGWENITSHLKLPDVDCIALCDIDEEILNKRASEIEKQTGKAPSKYKDFRKLLEQKDVDAVIIATPDHWHALQMIYACEAGKDVYVEKPMANSIEECNVMVNAAKRYNRIVQVGQQQRSGTHWKNVIEFVQSGKLGKIRTVRSWSYVPWRGSLDKVNDETVPSGVDYDMWLGPAPLRAYNKNRYHSNFRFFWDYAGGFVTDWAPHMMDIGLAAMNVKFPKSVSSTGGKYVFPDDAKEVPDTLHTIFEYDNCVFTWEHAGGVGRGPFDRLHGVAFYGTNGVLVADRNGWEILPESSEGKPYKSFKMESIPYQPANSDDRLEHSRNFVECIKSRKQPICDVEAGRVAAINAHLANIAYKTGNKLKIDPGTGNILNDKQAQALMKVQYRKPWVLPKV